MKNENFEGSSVLEKLAEIGMIDDFYVAIDNDNLKLASELMKRAEIDQETIDTVLQKIIDGED